MTPRTEKMQTVIVSGSLIRITSKREHPICTEAGSSVRGILGYFRQFPGFERHMAESASRGLKYAVFVGKQNIGEGDLDKPTGREVIRIVPVIAGSKRAGLLQTIIGVVLIVLSPFTNGATLAPGIALAAGGVIQMLSPQAKGLGTQDSPNNRPSYSFSGPVNTSIQGNPVPLLYGRMIVGSAVISAGIYTENQM
ncbi:tail assembly protein [Pseudomonas gingeri]|uniref:Tail assembly protein n=1 Tax=Pseudomonas gingeri TaxID=117681 RepID=A0A7Y7XJN4_9PSED|nr:tail assembly protein [Pseudomonas gingeri]NWC00842.1 tail assembly protein [Pseudomonas gingeri]